MFERPAARYGRQPMAAPSRRWAVAAVAVVVLVAGVAIAVVAFQRLGNHTVKGELAGYRLVDEETVAVTINITRDDPSRPAVCIVRARSIDGAETGRREVLVAPSAQATVQVTTTVKSTRPPVVGDVYGCGTDVPAYLVAS